MIYIKLEENRDKFMAHFNSPKSMRKLLFKSKCRNGKFVIEKVNPIECIVIPEVNQKMLNKLKILANVRCWRNICVSNNLLENPDFLTFASSNSLNIMDGRWLFKKMADKVVEYAFEVFQEKMENKEVAILCNDADDTIFEKIKEIASRVKVCHILTNNRKQFQKLEEDFYRNKGIILDVSSNYKKAILKARVLVNFDFSKKDLEKKCIFSKDSILINIKEDCEISKKYWEGKNITFFAIDMPSKYLEYQEKLEGFETSILYESLIFKNTSYRNIKKELEEDDAKILYLIDCQQEILKKSLANFPKTLDKIVN